MDRDRLFEKLDIDSPEEFRFYENFDALVEEEEHIEEELIKEVLSHADAELLSDHVDSFFESFLGNIPDDETELYIIVESFKNNISALIFEDMNDEDVSELAKDIYKFRNWYAIEHNAKDEKSGEELSVRDARYEIAAARLLGDEVSIDFGRAITSGPDSYGIRISELAAIEG